MSSGRSWGAKANRVHPPEYNLALARAILEQLEQFLQSDDAFWPLPARPPSPGIPFPRLSLGALSLALDELRAVETDIEPSARSAIQAVEREFDRITQKWTAAVERKALAEASQRVSVWRAYLQDLRDLRTDPADYRQEVKQRVILSRLLGLARSNPDNRVTIGALEGLDRNLRSLFAPGDFIWDIRLERVYPEADFWFLYGGIRI
jgi:hypothetical protein